MIKLDDIKDKSALELLKSYKGKNPYILLMQKEFNKNGKLRLTETQSKYIIDNFNKEPIKINRIIEISEFLGEELKRKENLSFTPKRILIQYILAETEKSLHIYGKVKQNQEKSKMYWVPKTQLIDDPYLEPINIDVDFQKYIDLDTLHRNPYNHQKEGIKFLLSRNGCILADDMGLGKSYQAIIAALESGVEKILIVCPSSVKINWEREINMFTDHTSIISGSKWKPNKFTIINYDILKNFHSLNKRRGKKEKPTDPVIEFKQEIANHKFDLCIIDEAHYLKNPKSIRGKIMSDLCINHGINKVWLLTGTPIANRPMDYFNLLKIIKAPIADNWVFFAKRYCAGKKFFKQLQNGQRKQIWLTDGASNLDELSNKTKNIILRRKKEDVLDMPEKTIIPVLQELSKKAWEQYDKLWDEYIDKKREEAEKNGIEFTDGTLQRDLIELILLRQFIAMEAIPYTIELAENAIEQNQKVIIFTNFTDELLELQEHFGNECVVHYGALSTKEKQNAVDNFMTNPKIKVFIGNIKSAGVGINLTVSNIVIFNSFDWVPGNNEQAEDRAYRIGQNNNVTVYYQLFKDTISLRMWNILQNKKEIISTIMGDTPIKEISEEERMILNYIEQLKKDENEKG